MKRVLICGYHGFGNSGDEAILLAIKNNLIALYPDLQLTVLSHKPEETEKIYDIHAVQRFDMIQVIKTIKQADLVISGGGSLLQDVTSTRSLFYYLSIIYLAKRFKKPVMLYANGIGPINKSYNRKITKKIINHVDLITLRESISKDECEQLGIKKVPIIITADPALTLEAAPKGHVLKILESAKIPLDKPIVGISLRPWEYGRDFEQKIAYIGDQLIENRNVNIVFLPMQIPRDIKVCNNVMMHMKNKSYLLEKTYSASEIIGLIGKMELLMSMRLHTLIFSTIVLTPMFGLVYDPKVANFLKLVEQPFSEALSNLNEQKMLQAVTKLYDNRQIEREKLQKKSSVLKTKALQNAHLAIELLRKTPKQFLGKREN